ncbi:hypothetical protein L2E82_07046 [Cichorium intybus]|uniref:Uncharacterized protein n=1 Tax=Cichorium intybus TaxID=13427 RepID=A0ACB9G4Q8_CICIN|nr:hypothetical protein L2E82_07046 [Cichorium intybus]
MNLPSCGALTLIRPVLPTEARSRLLFSISPISVDLLRLRATAGTAGAAATASACPLRRQFSLPPALPPFPSLCCGLL